MMFSLNFKQPASKNLQGACLIDNAFVCKSKKFKKVFQVK